MKKFLVLALSLCMVLALCVCGFAEEDAGHDFDTTKSHKDYCEVKENNVEWSYKYVSGCHSYDCKTGEVTFHLHCSVCGDQLDTKTFSAAPVEHNVEEYEAVAPECKKDGLTAGYKCLNTYIVPADKNATGKDIVISCNHAKAQETDPATGVCEPEFDNSTVHAYIAAQRKAGNVVYCDQFTSKPQTCKWCGETIANAVLGSVSHVFRADNVSTADDYVEPTCTKDGTYAYKKCLYCESVVMNGKTYRYDKEVKSPEFAAQQKAFDKAHTIPKLDHKLENGESAWVDVVMEIGACQGYVTMPHKKCQLCEATDPAVLEKVFIDHLFEEVTKAKDATCDEKGWVEHYKCSRNGCDGLAVWNKDTKEFDVKSEDEIFIPAKNHKAKTVIDGKAPTCEETGYAPYYKCLDCGAKWLLSGKNAKPLTEEEYEKLIVIPAIGHSDAPKGYYPLAADELVSDWKLKVHEGSFSTIYTIVDSIWDNTTVRPVDWDAYQKVIGDDDPKTKWADVDDPKKYCEDEGYSATRYCLWCGEIRSAGHKLQPAEHNWVITKAGYDATCDKDGVSKTEECSKCGKIQGGVKINAKGHLIDWDTYVEGVAPTCTSDGYFGYAHCVREDVEDDDHVVVFRQNYSVRVVEGEDGTKAATIISGANLNGNLAPAFGFYEDASYYDFDDDGDIVLEESNFIGKFDHGYASYLVGENGESLLVADIHGRDATCTQIGIVANTGKYCMYCDAWLVEPDYLPMVSHDYEYLDAEYLEPNCTEKGSYEAQVCNKCFQIFLLGYNADKEWDVVGVHQLTKWDADDAEAKEKIIKAAIEKYVVRPANGHKEIPATDIPATCTTKGYINGVVCEVCGHVVKEATEVKELGHNKIEIPAVPVTCTTDGHTAQYWCDQCGTKDKKNIVDKGEVIPMLGHTAGEKIEYLAPTCTVPGHLAGLKCATCDEYIIEPVEIPAWHSYVVKDENGVPVMKDGKVVTASYLKIQEGVPYVDCKGVAFYTYTYCTNPDCDYDPANDVDAGFMVPSIQKVQFNKNGTVKEQEYNVYAFDEDGEPTGLTTTVVPVIPAAVLIAPQHDWKVVPQLDATCTEDGMTESKTCLVCGEKVVGTVIKATGHNWVVAKKPATCTEEGYDGPGKVCTKCDEKTDDYEKSKVLPATGHTEVHCDAVPATCTEPGTTAGTKCDVCGIVMTGCQPVKATGHNQGKWIIERPATLPELDPEYGGYGLEVRRCTDCNEPLESRPIDPLQKGNMGDVNGDGSVDAIDALAIKLYDVGLLSPSRIDMELADINNDGSVDSIDALYVLKMSV